MSKLSRILMIVVLFAVVGGVVYLASFDLAASTARVEKVLPDERFKQ